jgi:hypothetical protein
MMQRFFAGCFPAILSIPMTSGSAGVSIAANCVLSSYAASGAATAVSAHATSTAATMRTTLGMPERSLRPRSLPVQMELKKNSKRRETSGEAVTIGKVLRSLLFQTPMADSDAQFHVQLVEQVRGRACRFP